jgi:hypothetical protein
MSKAYARYACCPRTRPAVDRPPSTARNLFRVLVSPFRVCAQL